MEVKMDADFLELTQVPEKRLLTYISSTTAFQALKIYNHIIILHNNV